MVNKKQKAARTAIQTAQKTWKNHHIGNNSKSQRLRLLEALRKRSMSALQIRRELDILGVALRIFELKGEGYNIITYPSYEETDRGELHHVALYALLNEAPNV